MSVYEAMTTAELIDLYEEIGEKILPGVRVENFGLNTIRGEIRTHLEYRKQLRAIHTEAEEYRELLAKGRMAP